MQIPEMKDDEQSTQIISTVFLTFPSLSRAHAPRDIRMTH